MHVIGFYKAASFAFAEEPHLYYYLIVLSLASLKTEVHKDTRCGAARPLTTSETLFIWDRVSWSFFVAAGHFFHSRYRERWLETPEVPGLLWVDGAAFRWWQWLLPLSWPGRIPPTAANAGASE